MVDLSDLLAFTEYTVEITACNILINKHIHGCSLHSSRTTFRTKRGKPGQPNEPEVKFKNATIVEIKWDSKFQVLFSNLSFSLVYCDVI